LNVGPTAEGLFPEPSIKRLNAIGKWMEVNGESIYGTSASLFSDLKWGRSTTKGRKVYLHIFEWPENRTLEVPGLKERADSVYLLQNPEASLTIEYNDTGALIQVPEDAPNPYVSVIALKFATTPVISKK